MYIMIFETRRCPVASSKETGRQVNLIFMFIVNSFDILSMSLNLDKIRPALDSDPPARMLRHCRSIGAGSPIYIEKWELRHSFNTMWTFVIVFIATIVQGKLLQQLPTDFCNSTDVVWIGSDQFMLPWQFSWTSEGRAYSLRVTYCRSNLGY